MKRLAIVFGTLIALTACTAQAPDVQERTYAAPVDASACQGLPYEVLEPLWGAPSDPEVVSELEPERKFLFCRMAFGDEHGVSMHVYVTGSAQEALDSLPADLKEPSSAVASGTMDLDVTKAVWIGEAEGEEMSFGVVDGNMWMLAYAVGVAESERSQVIGPMTRLLGDLVKALRR